MDKLIITAAITGNDTVPSVTPYLPISPEQMAEESRRATEAGAAVIHVHARDPEDGHPTTELGIYRRILEGIKAKTNAIVGISTGGSLGMSVDERLRTIPEFRPEMASFNLGSMNYGLYTLSKRYTLQHQWERDLVEGSKRSVFVNTFADMERICQVMQAYGTKPELEAYDVGHLYNARQLLRDGILARPCHVQFVMGVLGGIGASVENLLHMKHTADTIFGDGQYLWSVIGVGYPAEFHLGAMAIIMGGHVRVGMEDNVRVSRQELAKSNAELVDQMVKIALGLGREIATPDEARQMLGLKGVDKVAY